MTVDLFTKPKNGFACGGTARLKSAKGELEIVACQDFSCGKRRKVGVLFSACSREVVSISNYRQMRKAPRLGLEPRTVRLTVGCSTIELSRNEQSKVTFRRRRVRATQATFVSKSRIGIRPGGSKRGAACLGKKSCPGRQGRFFRHFRTPGGTGVSPASNPGGAGSTFKVA